MSNLGNKLRNARVEKGYTLNSLQQVTKIQKKYLQAIEEGDFKAIPGKIYLNAFVKQYAETVDLDGDQLLMEYEDEINHIQDEGIDYDTTPSEELPSRLKRYNSDEKSNLELAMSYIPMIILLLIIGAIIVTLMLAINRINSENRAEQASRELASNAAVSVLAPESAAPTVSTAPDQESQASQELADNQLKVGPDVITKISQEGSEDTYQLESPMTNYKFVVEGLQESITWVGIYEDDVIVVDSTVTKGEKIEYQASPGTQQLRIRMGYPEGARIMVNGQTLELNNPYFQDTVLFVAGAEAADSSSRALELGNDGSEGAEAETGYQGPAVLDPNYDPENE